MNDDSDDSDDDGANLDDDEGSSVARDGGAADAKAGGSGKDGSSGMANGAPSRPPTTESPGAFDECAATMQMAENELQPADIIFIIDTSGSMGEEVGFVQENMNAFSRKISESGVDARVILIARPKDGLEIPAIETAGLCIDAPLGSGSCPEDSKAPSYVHVPMPVGDWDILQTCIDNYSMYKEYLRPNSYKSFVAISDGDLDIPFLLPPVSTADTFIDAVAGLEPDSMMWSNWRYSAIYPFTQCPSSYARGTAHVHADLVERTGGVGGDLCLQDFAPVFDALAEHVTTAVTLACDWEIPPPPDGETLSPGKTNVQLTLEGTAEPLLKAPSATECGSRQGWYYDDPDAPIRVVACPETCKRIQSAKNARVDLLFGCATEVFL